MAALVLTAVMVHCIYNALYKYTNVDLCQTTQSKKESDKKNGAFRSSTSQETATESSVKDVIRMCSSCYILINKLLLLFNTQWFEHFL